jgi:hypothetical protein
MKEYTTTTTTTFSNRCKETTTLDMFSVNICLPCRDYSNSPDLCK